MSHQPKQKEYNLPVYEGLEDGSEGRETVTIEQVESQSRTELRAIHEHGDETDYYRFRVTDEQLHVCTYTGSYSSSPEQPPGRVLQAVEVFGYTTKDKEVLGESAMIMHQYGKQAKSFSETIKEREQSLPIDTKLIDFVTSSVQSFTSFSVFKSKIPQEKFKEIHDEALDTLEITQSEEVSRILVKLGKTMTEIARTMGYEDIYEEVEK